MYWIPIDEAEKISGHEVIGVVIREGRIVKEPFMTFWSPSLDRFYCSPTHFVWMPKIRAEKPWVN